MAGETVAVCKQCQAEGREKPATFPAPLDALVDALIRAHYQLEHPAGERRGPSGPRPR